LFDFVLAKSEARETMRMFFGRIGRPIYVAVELSVLYPGEEAIEPDLIAVRGVSQHRRDSWMGAREGRGIDLALEILDKGSRRKDLVENVKEYARLGITEYFVFDVRRGRIHAFRLSDPASKRYTPVLSNGGRYRSEVLELDLAVVNDQLRFYYGSAELSTKDEELAKLTLLIQQEQARAEQEQARAEQEQARARQACAELAEAILLMARLRGIALSEQAQARIRAASDVALLSRWVQRAATFPPTAPPDDFFLDS
jgi:hypothetical protein